MIQLQPHNWIGHSKVEAIGILSIPFMCTVILFFLPSSFLRSDNIPEFLWLFLVVFVDVGHVYSTLYRTYADKAIVNKHRHLFFGLPLILLILSVMLHSVSHLLFWRCLAYFAVYHFIRQQYGFLKIYSRKSDYSKTKRIIDTLTIYSATALPVLYWHFSPDRNFSWFLKGDFLLASTSIIIPNVIIGLFWFMMAIYSISEFYIIFKTKFFNVQKNSIVLGTALSWYLGIIYFNSDFVFTFLNIICHGIPYMSLVWIHGKKTYATKPAPSFLKIVYGRFSILLFLLPLLLFAYVEESFWDAFVWNEHSSLLLGFKNFHLALSKNVLNIVVPLLALPQLFHYVIDGFIWKLKQDKFEWTSIL
ncbi:MAG: hypothetical protein V4580_01365 [Bacteroidota bacterium]